MEQEFITEEFSFSTEMLGEEEICSELTAFLSNQFSNIIDAELEGKIGNQFNCFVNLRVNDKKLYIIKDTLNDASSLNVGQILSMIPNLCIWNEINLDKSFEIIADDLLKNFFQDNYFFTVNLMIEEK